MEEYAVDNAVVFTALSTAYSSMNGITIEIKIEMKLFCELN